MSEAGRPGPLPSNWVRTLHFDQQQQLWVGTDSGLVRYQPATGQFSTYQWQPAVPTSLPDNHVRGLFQDRTGLLWVGTDNGVSSVVAHANSFAVLPLGWPGPASIFAVSEDARGQVWMGTEQHGLIRYDPATRQCQNYRHDPATPGSLSEDFVRVVYPAPDGTLWVGTRSRGLDQLIPGTARFRHHPLPAEQGTGETLITALLADGHGNLWVGTEGGLRHFSPATGRWRTYRHDPADRRSLSNNLIYCLYRDRRQRLWVGTGGGGLCLLEDEARGRFRTFPADERVLGWLSSPFVRHITEDSRGRLWAGTEGGGLCQLVDERQGRFVSIREAQGLPEDVVYGVLEDEQGRLWLSSNKGLARYDPGTGAIHTFDGRDGLGQDEFNAGAFWRDRSGRLYFGGVNGVVAFRAATVRTNRRPPPVVFTGLRKFDQLVELDSSVTERRQLRIPPRDNSFTLEFAALNFEHPDKNRYEYRLEGFNDHWIAAGTKHEATYTNLAPGRYTLHVRAANNDGVWNRRGAALGIVVEPAWYQTWWFRLAAVAAVAGTLYLLYRLRVAQLLALERVRYGIARDLHDDVGSTLSSISVLAEVAHSHYHGPHPERAAALLEQIGESSRRMLDSMGDIVWTINPGHDSLEDVIVRMRSFASNTLEARDIDFIFEVAPGVPDLKLSMSTRRDLFLIYKEALNNLVKYARCREAAIRLGYEQHRLLLTVQDDGVGFDAAAPALGGGNGLGNMRSRAAGMGGELHIDTVPGQGTTLRLNVPLTK
jgi:signal transduction histidine kinase/streptogramin lyase